MKRKEIYCFNYFFLFPYKWIPNSKYDRLLITLTMRIGLHFKHHCRVFYIQNGSLLFLQRVLQFCYLERSFHHLPGYRICSMAGFDHCVRVFHISLDFNSFWSSFDLIYSRKYVGFQIFAFAIESACIFGAKFLNSLAQYEFFEWTEKY